MNKIDELVEEQRKIKAEIEKQEEKESNIRNKISDKYKRYHNISFEISQLATCKGW